MSKLHYDISNQKQTALEQESLFMLWKATAPVSRLQMPAVAVPSQGNILEKARLLRSETHLERYTGDVIIA